MFEVGFACASTHLKTATTVEVILNPKPWVSLQAMPQLRFLHLWLSKLPNLQEGLGGVWRVIKPTAGKLSGLSDFRWK